MTAKHINSKNGNVLATKKHQCTYNCILCSKTFNDRSGLWRHKKKCNYIAPLQSENKISDDIFSHDISFNDVKILTNLVFDIVKQNQEFKKLISEQGKQLVEISKNSNITNNNCINNTINNKFNLQVFLNDKCKDALNITEFIDSLKITYNDLENVGSLGYVEGISKIFMKGLNQLDIYKRPIHCSDLKRETMYIKEQNTWERDNEDKNKLKMVIKNIAHKNTKVIPFWRDANPEAIDINSKKNDQYMKILYESMGPCNNEEDDANYNKIIKKIAKEVTIDKNIYK
jgi:hypothetical protein